MKEYTIVRRPENLDWSTIPALEITEPLRSPTASPVRATAQICYDDEALYVHFAAYEPNMRAELNGKLDEVCEDSCMEFFFSPLPGDLRYFNIECNFNCAMYLGMGSNAHNLIRFVPEEPPISPKATKTSDGWMLDYAIPYTFIRQFFPEFAPAPGCTIRANCYKCGDKTVPPHHFAWNPIPILPYASFHNPEAFGVMHFA